MQYADAINFERQGGGFQKAYADTAQAFVDRQLPRFQQRLQLTREDLIRRGVSTGDTGVAAEFDLSKQFGDSLADTLGGMSMDAYENNRGRYLDLLTGQLDRDQGNANAKSDRKARLWGSLMNMGGQAAGSYYGARGG